MIAAQGVSLQYGGRVLFNDVNINFTKGNCYGLIGANGAGKSTFLKILAGELEPNKGSVFITPGERMAVLKQDHFLFDEFDVVECVLYGHKRLYDIRKEKDALYMKEDFTDEDGIKAAELEGEFAELDGWAAEEYARMRHSSNADNDYKRTARQRTVVSQVLERVKGMNVMQINALVDELLDKVLTDMTNSDITTCITELLPLLPEMTMDSLQCPNADMDLSGKLIDLFKDGSPEQSIQTFTESKAKAIITAITEDD